MNYKGVIAILIVVAILLVGGVVYVYRTAAAAVSAGCVRAGFDVPPDEPEHEPKLQRRARISHAINCC